MTGVAYPGELPNWDGADLDRLTDPEVRRLLGDLLDLLAPLRDRLYREAFPRRGSWPVRVDVAEEYFHLSLCMDYARRLWQRSRWRRPTRDELERICAYLRALIIGGSTLAAILAQWAAIPIAIAAILQVVGCAEVAIWLRRVAGQA